MGFDFKKVEQQPHAGGGKTEPQRPWVDRFKMFGHSVERNQNGDPLETGTTTARETQWICNLRSNQDNDLARARLPVRISLF